MRENYVAYIVRPCGDSWELLVLSTWCGATLGNFDVTRGRIPHHRDADEIIRRDAAAYDIKLDERMTTLGDEPLLETRRRMAYVYRAADGLPPSWTKRLDPPRGKNPALPQIVGHFRFLDLRDPIPIGQDEVGWLDDVRKLLGVAPPPEITLVFFAPADIGMSESDARAVAHELFHRRPHAFSLSRDFQKIKRDIRKWTGWTSDTRRLAMEVVSPDGEPRALVARLKPDGTAVAQARTAVITSANAAKVWTYDLTNNRLFRENESPVGLYTLPRPVSHERALLELKFDRELLAELSRLHGGPLMLWPLSPTVNETGTREDYRDPGLPHALWALPANQALLLDMKLFSYMDTNSAMICPLVTDFAPLVAFEQRRRVASNGVTTIHSFDQMSDWDRLLEHVGWTYLPNGPDTLWGDLHAEPRKTSFLEKVRDWCRATGRTWVRYDDRGGEVVRVVVSAQTERI